MSHFLPYTRIQSITTKEVPREPMVLFIYLKKKKIYLFVCLCWVLVATCGAQFPDQGSTPHPLHRECGVLGTGPPGKSHILHFIHPQWMVTLCKRRGSGIWLVQLCLGTWFREVENECQAQPAASQLGRRSPLTQLPPQNSLSLT